MNDPSLHEGVECLLQAAQIIELRGCLASLMLHVGEIEERLTQLEQRQQYQNSSSSSASSVRPTPSPIPVTTPTTPPIRNTPITNNFTYIPERVRILRDRAKTTPRRTLPEIPIRPGVLSYAQATTPGVTTSNRYQALQPEEAAVFEPDKPDENDIPTSDSQIQRAVTNRRPNICITEKYVQNMSGPTTSTVHQEDNTSSEYQQEVTSIISDSMTRSIRVKYFNSHLDERKEIVKISKFPAAHANQIRLYAQYSLQVDKPSRVIIAAGSNDVAYDMSTGSADPEVIAKRILDIAWDARNEGVREGFISGLMKRRVFNIVILYHRLI